MAKGSRRRNIGSGLAEAAATMAVMLPLIFALVYMISEVSQTYIIKQGLSQAAREAARQLAVTYNRDNQIKSSRILQDRLVFDSIRQPNIVNSSKQFRDPVWDFNGDLPTVSVTVSYTSGQNGLPVFPAPDPINMGTKVYLAARSVYRVE